MFLWRSHGSVRACMLTCIEEDHREMLQHSQHKHIKTDIWTKIPLFEWLLSLHTHPIPLHHFFLQIAHFLLLFTPSFILCSLLLSLSAPEAWWSECRCEVSLGVLVRVGSSGLTLLSLSLSNEPPLWFYSKHSSSVQEPHRSSTTGKYWYTAESRPRKSITVNYKVKLEYCWDCNITKNTQTIALFQNLVSCYRQNCKALKRYSPDVKAGLKVNVAKF